MRDGIHLNATVYTPRDQSAPAPCILVMTPYISDQMHALGVYFASHGFPFAAVDVRGRGNSEGAFNPYIQEAQDGYDVVEWLGSQLYCNGKVAMCGGSYLGYCQWVTAKEFPPHLATIVPAAAPCMGVDFPMRSNIFHSFVIQWLTLTGGQAAQWKIFMDGAFWTSIYRRGLESGRPFRELDTIAGNPSRVFQEWLEHPEPDAYWDAMNPTAEQCARLELPILTLTGSYDDDQPGALEHYKSHRLNASPAARAKHYLVIGPWDHAGTAAPRAEFGGITVAPAGLLDLQKLHLEWFSWVLQDGPKPGFLKKPVAYYVMGAEQWRYADTLDAITAHHRPYFLSSTGDANDIFASGFLGDGPGEGRGTYSFDPADVTGAEVDAEARADGGSLIDQRVTLSLRGKQLVYHSAPFEEDVEVSGFFKLTAWIAIDTPDTDLYVSVHEVRLDGTSVRLTTDAIRARYRNGLRSAVPIETHECLRYDFERFTFISRQIKRGHRLRLIIAPMGRLADATFSQRNFNSGGVVADECAQESRTVTVRLFHDSSHPSALYLPVAQASASSRSNCECV
jgi:putative CocE/NonD family hydrolase